MNAEQQDTRCGHCGRVLTADEREFYGTFCEGCETELHHALQDERPPVLPPPQGETAPMMRLKAENARLRAELAERQIVSARLTAWTDGYGGVEIILAGGRRIALALDAPHGGADPTLRLARESRLGPGAHLGKLPDRLFSAMMDGEPREVTDLIRLAEPEATRKQVYNALGYLARRGYVERLRYGTYRTLARVDGQQRGGGDAA